MKISYKRPPKKVSDAIRRWRSANPDVHERSQATRKRTKQAGVPDVPLRPHQLYYLSLLQVVSGAKLDSAVPIGWRHLSSRDEGIVETIVEAVSDREFRAPHSRQIPLSHKSADIHKGLHKISARFAGSYEMRTVTIPPLMTLGIWLKSSRLEPSKIIPVHSVVRDLPAGRSISERKLLATLAEPARQLLEYVPQAPGPMSLHDKGALKHKVKKS